MDSADPPLAVDCLSFTVAAIVNIVALVQGEPAVWVRLVAVLPLAVLLFAGLNLFVPYATRWDSGGRTD